MDCHSCATAAEIAAGKWRGNAWRSTPCAKCHASDYSNNHGRTHVPFDEALGPGPGGKIVSPLLERDRVKTMAVVHAAEAKDHPIFTPGTKGASTDQCIAAMSYIAKAVLSLHPTTREIVLDRLAFPFQSLRVVADRLKIPLSTCHDHLKRARREWPALAFALPMKDGGDGKAGLSRKTNRSSTCRN